MRPASPSASFTAATVCAKTHARESAQAQTGQRCDAGLIPLTPPSPYGHQCPASPVLNDGGWIKSQEVISMSQGKDTTTDQRRTLVQDCTPPGAAFKSMFGHPTARVNGRPLWMLVDGQLGLHPAPQDVDSLRDDPNGGVFAPRGTCRFSELVLVPESSMRETTIRPLIARAAEHARKTSP
jgi:hypothetical protein